MNATLIRDTFKYFAKFPLLAGVQSNFNKSDSSYFPPLEGAGGGGSYATLKAEIAALTTHSLIPGITDYVFGVDETVVKKRIEQINGIYLFVDYGNISDMLSGEPKVETGELIIAVTVARKTPLDGFDTIESLLLADKTLEYISTIKDTMKTDSKSVAYVKPMTFPAEISPWFARELFNSCGWTMTFRKKGVHLI